jgi:hypothetical protein
MAQALGPQNPPPPGAPARVAKTRDFVMKRGTGDKAGVKIKLSDKTQIKGFISQAGSDDFVVIDSKTGTATSVAYQNVIEITRSGLSTGTKIAIFTGIGVVVIVIVAAVALSRDIELGPIPVTF